MQKRENPSSESPGATVHGVQGASCPVMTAGCTETPTAASVPRVEHTPSSATSMAEGATSSNSATAMAKASGAELSSYLGGLTLQVFLMGTWIGGLLLLPTMLILLSCGQATFATALLALAAAAYVGPPLDRQKLLAWIRANSGGMFRAMSCTREEPDCKQGPTLVAYHPHGMFSWGFFAQTAADLSTIPLAKVAPILPLQPLFRYIFVRSLGCCRSASKPSVTHTMRAEESFCILPGGFEEAVRRPRARPAHPSRAARAPLRPPLRSSTHAFPRLVPPTEHLRAWPRPRVPQGPGGLRQAGAAARLQAAAGVRVRRSRPVPQCARLPQAALLAQ